MTLRLVPTTDKAKVRELDHKWFGKGTELPFGPKSRGWFLMDGGAIVGYCVLGLYEGYAFLSRAAIDKEYRGKNVQLRLIRVREAAARRAGYTRIITYTSDDNMRSANNLLKAGYRLYIPQQKFGVKHALYFEKTL